MKKLLLLRHAKSDRGTGFEDFERPLNARGRKAAPKMAEAMLARDYMPDAVLISPAQRTRETWQLMAAALGVGAPRTEFDERLYLASAKQIFDLLRKIAPDAAMPLVIGHNPGIEDLATRLASERQSAKGEEALDKIRRKYPTCALTVFQLPIDNWIDLSLASGTLLEFLTPSSLED